jgi:hypothetical protein
MVLDNHGSYLPFFVWVDTVFLICVDLASFDAKVSACMGVLHSDLFKSVVQPLPFGFEFGSTSGGLLS